MDQRVATIRTFILFTAAVVASFVSIEASLSVMIAAGLGMFPGCSPCCSSCGGCSSTFKNQYQIVVSGITKPGGSSCTTGCTDANATYTVTAVSDPTTVGLGATDCYAEASINPCLCVLQDELGADYAKDAKFAVNRIYLRVFKSGADSIARSGFTHNTTGTDCHTLNSGTIGASAVEANKTYSSPTQPNCVSFSSEDLGVLGGGILITCNWGSSDVKVTAI